MITRKWALVGRLILGCLWLWLGVVPLQAQGPEGQGIAPLVLDEGWQYRWGDSSLEAAMAEEGAWQPLDTLRFPRQAESFLWLRVTLPANQWRDPTLYLPGVYRTVELYDVRGLLYQDPAMIDPGHFQGYRWHLIPLEPPFAGQTLYFRIYSDQAHIGLSLPPRLGSRGDLILAMIRQDIDRLLLGGFFIFMGLLPLLAFLRRRQEWAYPTFGLFALTIGIIVVDGTAAKLLFVDAPTVWWYIGLLAAHLMPIGFLTYLEQIFGKGPYSLLRRLLQIHILYSLGVLLAALLTGMPLEAGSRGLEQLMLVGIALVVTLTLAQAVRGNAEARILALGISVLCLAGVLTLLKSLDWFDSPIQFTHWGMLLFVLSLGLILVRRFIETRDLLRLYSQELEQKNEALRQMDRLKDEFLANTSHELRTPLNGIIGLAETMLEGVGGSLEPLQQRNLALIAASGHRLATLVDDILDFAKLKHRQLVLQRKSVNMQAVADLVLTLSEPLCTGKAVRLVNAIPPTIPSVLADENRVQQILHNLVGNAIKFSKQGEVRVSAEPRAGWLAISVADEGIGIPEALFERIFESFEQADGSIARQYGGTGLGLSISKQLVALHGGQLTVTSTVGAGSCFTFTLPLAEEAAEPEPTAPRPALAAAPLLRPGSEVESLVAASEATYHILAVDDEPINLQVLSNLLSLRHYHVTTAASGQEALQKLETSRYDLVLLDLMMPGLSGYESCRRIRERFAASELPVILLTAKNQVVDLVEGFQAGANDYLTKPFARDELLARIRTHLRLAKINSAYSRFVPREFLHLLGQESIVEVRLGDQVQMSMSVLFSDIRSFTRLSERMSPRETFNFLNSYLSRTTPVIRAHQGFVDKYIGDAIMALFPQQPEDALTAALALREVLKEYNEHRQSTGYDPIETGIGIHTGSLILGTIGHEDQMQGTVIADTVNIAAHLEALTKRYGASILASGAVLAAIAQPERYERRFLGEVRVKGKQHSLPIYEILNSDPPALREHKMASRERFEAGVREYMAQAWQPALAHFEGALALAPDDPAARYYQGRCQQALRYGPAEGWTAVDLSLDNKL